MDWNIRIDTPRLVLREFVEDDWAGAHKYAVDPEVVRFMVWGPNTEDDTKSFVHQVIEWQRAPERRVFDLAVERKADGKMIGSCGFHLARTVSEGSSQSVGLGTAGSYNIDPRSYIRGQNAAVGYCFSRESWGQGYASEAASGVLRFGFEQLELHKMFATCDVHNLGSARVLEKIGMRREGHMREDVKVKGKWRDSYLYAVLKTEWNPLD